MNRNLLLKIRTKKKNVYAQQKQGQVKWEEYKDGACHHNEEMHATKAHLSSGGQ